MYLVLCWHVICLDRQCDLICDKIIITSYALDEVIRGDQCMGGRAQIRFGQSAAPVAWVNAFAPAGVLKPTKLFLAGTGLVG